MDHGLARGCLAAAPLHHLAHDHVVNGARVDPGPAHRLADGQRAELRGGEAGEPAQVLADGRTAGGDDDGDRGIGHRRNRMQEDWRFGTGGKIGTARGGWQSWETIRAPRALCSAQGAPATSG